MSYINLYDTTLRDGAQSPLVHFTMAGKIEAARQLDSIGFDYLEAGFPQAGGQDGYFSQVRSLGLKTKIAAFGMTPRSHDFENDPNLKSLIDAGTDVVTLVAKTPESQIRGVLRMSPHEYRALARQSIRYLKSLGKDVMLDSEHFFDAYKEDRKEAMEMLQACGDADWLVLCDTNGGMDYRDVGGVVKDVKRAMGDRIGVHFHNDRGQSLPCTLEAVYAGARQLQGTMNNMGERTGNANMAEIISNLFAGGFEMGADPKMLTDVSRALERLSGWSILPNAPFVGRFAFAHSGGMHSDAMLKMDRAYEHFRPEDFGNKRSFPVSGQAGRAAIVMKLNSWGYDFGKNSPVVVGLLRDLDDMGYVGDAQLHRMFMKGAGGYKNPIEIVKVDVSDNITVGGSRPEAIVKLRVDGRTFLEVSGGDGQVDAIDKAARKALRVRYPMIDDVKLLSYTVPPITGTGSDAAVKVWACFGYNSFKWDSFRNGTDIVAESAMAILDAYSFFLLRQEELDKR